MSHPSRGGLADGACIEHGLFTRTQAIAAGYDDSEIMRLLRGRTWYKVRRGVYVEHGRWDRLDDLERHELEVRAALMRIGPRPAFDQVATAGGREREADVGSTGVASHWSAAVVSGLALYRPDLSAVHLTRPARHAGRKEAGVSHHVGRLDPDETALVNGLPITNDARTVVDLAMSAPYESALVAADHALHRGLDRDTLIAQFLSQRAWPGARSAQRVVAEADGRSESPGETLTRVAFARIGLPPPQLQTEFFLADGRLFARVDFDWEEFQTFAEFDGKIKYYRDLPEGRDPGDIVFDEKKREDRLRSDYGRTGFRVIWPDVYPSAYRDLRNRALYAFDTASRRHGFVLPPHLRL